MSLNAVVSTFVSGDGVWVVFEELQPMVRGGEVCRGPSKTCGNFNRRPRLSTDHQNAQEGYALSISLEHKLTSAHNLNSLYDGPLVFDHVLCIILYYSPSQEKFALLLVLLVYW